MNVDFCKKQQKSYTPLLIDGEQLQVLCTSASSVPDLDGVCTPTVCGREGEAAPVPHIDIKGTSGCHRKVLKSFYSAS